jgi:PHD/YefM family antitoxin component YafN of YafNO toxin-antitoxin module
MSDPARLRVSNEELATVREAMRELGRLLDQLEEGQLQKVVLTQRNQMRAVLITVERYSEFERDLASAAVRNGLRAGAENGSKRPPRQAEPAR